MKFEAEQRKQEREFHLHMMSMICGRHSPHVPPGVRPIYSPQATSHSAFDLYGHFQATTIVIVYA